MKNYLAKIRSWRRPIGFMAILIALPFVAWLPLGWIGWVPSMFEIFTVPGLRIPASIVVGSCLIAAICHEKY